MSLFARNIRALSGIIQMGSGVHTSAVQNSAFRKWAYEASGFCKLGLWHNDCLDDSNPDVIEAVRRLPQDLVDQRNYRMLRAIQLNIQKSILPKEEWTKYEEDLPYLQPFIDEVIREREERESWNSKH